MDGVEVDVDVGVGVGVGVGGGGVENDGGFGFVPTRMAEELPRIIANPESDSSCGATGLLGGCARAPPPPPGSAAVSAAKGIEKPQAPNPLLAEQNPAKRSRQRRRSPFAVPATEDMWWMVDR